VEEEEPQLLIFQAVMMVDQVDQEVVDLVLIISQQMVEQETHHP
jgi:hypothetical protein